jgi:acyl-CoA-binding protein
MSDLKAKFEETVDFIQNGDGDYKPSNAMKLDLYAFFKQATEGDVSGDAPGFGDFVGKAKYSAWEKIKGMSADEAMQKYIDTVDELKALAHRAEPR